MLFRTNPFNDFSIQPEKIPNSFPWPINYWALKNWCFWTVLLGKTLESPLDDGKDIKPINPKGNQSWIFIGRTDAEAEALILRPPDARNWLPGKDPDAGKDWRQEQREPQRVRWLDGITNLMAMSLSKLGSWWCTGKPGMLQSMGSKKIRTWLSDWTELNWLL